MSDAGEFPSLFVSASERQAFQARLESPRGRPIWERVLTRAETAAGAADERPNGRASDRASVSRLARVIETCGLAYFVTGQERFVGRAKEALLELVAIETWVSGPPSRLGYSLQTGTMSQELAVGYDFLRDLLDEKQREHIITRWEE